jgi:hypothetical protein
VTDRDALTAGEDLPRVVTRLEFTPTVEREDHAEGFRHCLVIPSPTRG